jgi:hypothetical protein
VGDGDFDCREDRLHGADAASMGWQGRASATCIRLTMKNIIVCKRAACNEGIIITVIAIMISGDSNH